MYLFLFFFQMITAGIVSFLFKFVNSKVNYHLMETVIMVPGESSGVGGGLTLKFTVECRRVISGM